MLLVFIAQHANKLKSKQVLQFISKAAADPAYQHYALKTH